MFRGLGFRILVVDVLQGFQDVGPAGSTHSSVECFAPSPQTAFSMS